MIVPLAPLPLSTNLRLSQPLLLIAPPSYLYLKLPSLFTVLETSLTRDHVDKQPTSLPVLTSNHLMTSFIRPSKPFLNTTV